MLGLRESRNLRMYADIGSLFAERKREKQAKKVAIAMATLT